MLRAGATVASRAGRPNCLTGLTNVTVAVDRFRCVALPRGLLALDSGSGTARSHLLRIVGDHHVLGIRVSLDLLLHVGEVESLILGLATWDSRDVFRL